MGNTERYSILSSLLSPPPSFLPTRRKRPLPQLHQKKKKGRERGQRNHKTPLVSSSEDTQERYTLDRHTHTHKHRWLCRKHTENRPQAPQTQQRDFHQLRSHDWGGRGGRSRGRAIRGGGRIVVMPEPLSPCPSAAEGARGGGRRGKASENEETRRPGRALRSPPAACLSAPPVLPPQQ